MKNLIKKSVTLALSAVLIASSAAVPAYAKTEKKRAKNYVEGEVIAVLKDNAPAKFQSSSKAASAYGNGVKLTGSYTFSANKGNKLRIASLKSNSLSTEKLLKSLKANSAVKYAFPNYKKKTFSITNDKYSDYQWALENNGQNNGKKGSDIKPQALWKEAVKSDKEPVVAIVDTGIDFEHEDLKDILWENPYGSKLLGKHGYDATGINEDYEPRDDNGHGSHCAGIIAGSGDNKLGISGINKSGVKVMALKFLDGSGYGDTDDEIACFDYISRAVKLGTNVVSINCSYGGEGDEEAKLMYDELFDELGKQGIITCVSAGNEATDIDDTEGEDDDFWGGIYTTPACSESRYCLTVAATNGKDELASFSNYGRAGVDIAAPGTEILSSVSYNCFNPTIYSEKELKELCSYIQKYDSKIKTNDFGYPHKMEVSSADENEYEVADFSCDTSDEFFGKDGKSIAITHEDSGTLLFEMPYTLDEWSEDYSASFMIKCDGYYSGNVYDVPSYYTFDDIIGDDYYDDDFIIYSKKQKISEPLGGDPGYWSHITLSSLDEDDEEEYDYEDEKKSKNVDEDFDDEFESNDRKLVFEIETDSTVYLDDVAISITDPDYDAFGKYDFYNGTSMATPYVTGAVALVRNAYPDASTADVLNIVRNTGKHNEELDAMVGTSSVLSLDKTDELPPFITAAEFSDNGKLIVEGSFRDITSVKVNNKKVTPAETTNTAITLDDNNYNTTKVQIVVKNKYGNDALSTLISNKKPYTLSTETIGSAFDTSNGIMVNAGGEAYYIDSNNSVGVVNYNYLEEHYSYMDSVYQIDFDSIERLKDTVRDYGSAVYLDGKLYIAAKFNVMSSNGEKTIGYESALCSYDIKTGTLTDYGELRDEHLTGASLATYKGEVYLLGGYDYSTAELTQNVYKLTDGKLAKADFTLPEERAYTKFIEYDGKLIGLYGVKYNNEIPQIIVFDGNTWTKSKVELDSEDYDNITTGKGRVYQNYPGNLGFDKNGVFCSGAYCYGLGDTFTYDPVSDTVKSSDYSFNNQTNGPRLLGTTVPGAFVGFNVVIPVEEEEDDFFFWSMSTGYKNSIAANKADEYDINTYSLTLDNGEPEPYNPDDDYPDYPDYPDYYPTAKAKLSATSASLKAGATKKLKVTGASVKSWSSSNKKVATVKNGKVTALKKGTAKITATLKNGKKLTAKIKVTTNPKLSKKTVKVKVGKTVKVKITGKANGVKLKFKNTKLAKVVSKKTAKTLKIRGLKKGSTTLKITVNGKKLKLKVKVH